MGISLKRELGLFPVTSIVVANMIGSGMFLLPGMLMANLHDPTLMLALWAVGGTIALCGAFCYGELAAAIPEAGGEYAFLSRLVHPMAGFLSGWVSLIVGFSAPIAASAIGFVEYLSRAYPGLLNTEATNETTIIKKTAAVGVIVLFSAIHSRKITFGARIQNGLTILKVLLIVGLIVAGLLFGDGSTSNFRSSEGLNVEPASWRTIGLSLMWIMFAYSGWNAAAYIGSEVKNPRRTLPLSLIIGTVAVTTLYLGFNTFLIYGIPPNEMEGVISVAGLATLNLFGAAMERLFSVLIALAILSSLSAFIILGPRVYFAMAKDGSFFRFVATVDDKHRVPAKAIMLQCIISTVIVISGTFDQILTFMGFALGIFPIMAVLSIFKLRRKQKLTYKMPGYPMVPLFFISVSSGILLLSFIERPGPSLLAIATVAAGIPAYLAFRKWSKTTPTSPTGGRFNGEDL